MKREVPFRSVPGVDGRYFELANEEYVQVESNPESGVIGWSSDLPVDQVVTRMVETIGSASSDYEGLLIDHAGIADERPSGDLEREALKAPETVRMLTAVHGDAVVSWRSPQIKMHGGKTRHVEVCYAAPEVRWDVVSRLVDLTGTSEVKIALAKLSQDLIKSLGKHAVAD